jgi:hypothetical protein
MAYQHFLDDQAWRIQSVIAASSVAIRGLHPDPASLIAIFVNPNYFRAVAKVMSRLRFGSSNNYWRFSKKTSRNQRRRCPATSQTCRNERKNSTDSLPIAI